MKHFRSAFRASLILSAALALAACNTDGVGSANSGAGPGALSQPATPPVPIAGRWLFSSSGRQCNMTFGAVNAAAADGTIAPEGGCPGKFYMSRKWTYDQDGLTMRDHNGQPLAQLSGAAGRFDGKAASGEPVALAR